MTEFRVGPADVAWTPGEPPRSRAFDDVYFSREDGLAEARAVFLAGCDLPEAWQGKDRFTVAELGFGTGLNIVALLDLWRRSRPPGARLNIFSVEGQLMSRAQAARALAGWPQVADVVAALLERWPRLARGYHRLDLAAFGATLDIAVMEVEGGLEGWSGRADAWFLDGFAPSRNPEMWRPEVIDLVAKRSAPGARLATYTVAAAVRRDLAAAAFRVDRKPGFGRKRERLEGRFAVETSGSAPRPLTVAIIGGGIAAAALRRAFFALGVAAEVFAEQTRAPNASSGPCALVSPRLDAGLAAPAALFAQAFHRAIDLYREIPCGIISTGALNLARTANDIDRFRKIAGGDLFDPPTIRVLTADAASSLLGEPSSSGLAIDEAIVVDPRRLLSAWLGDQPSRPVAGLSRGAEGWSLESASGAAMATADVVIVAGGYASNTLAPTLKLGAVRGQASWSTVEAAPLATLAGGYILPCAGGAMFGATHDRGDVSTDEREIDHERNLAALGAVLPAMAARLRGSAMKAHTGIRATTTDFLPLAGAVGDDRDGLYVLSGLGSRGFCLAPLLAEHIAAIVSGLPSPLPQTLARLVDPARFTGRLRRRRRRDDTASAEAHEQP